MVQQNAKKMKYTISKRAKLAMAILCSFTVFASCSKWDDFKKYVEDGEISYVGKLDSVQVFSGKERVRLYGLFRADPKVEKVRVYWNDRKDSIDYSVDVAGGDRYFDEILPVEEGIRSFVFVTYDAKGNKSVPVTAIGRSYGDRYQNTLRNRLVSSAVDDGGVVRINWVAMDLSAGPVGTELMYASDTGPKRLVVPIDQEVTELDDLNNDATTFSFRTLFLPQAASIDTFYTDVSTAAIAKNVTDLYLKNTQVPMETSAQSDRWAIPTHWVVNEAARNHRDPDGNRYGGVDFWFGGPFLAMEAGWSDDNMTTIRDGKIHQTVSLPAGIYTFEMHIPDCTNGGEFYTVAALGEALPNVANLETSIAFMRTSTPGWHRLVFTLPEAATVSLGFVGNLESYGGGGGTFWRIDRVTLMQQVLVD